MSFKDKLTNLQLKQDAEAKVVLEEKNRLVEQARHIKINQEKQQREQFASVTRIHNEYIEPLLNEVNDIYLHGHGKLISYKDTSSSSFSILTELRWDDWIHLPENPGYVYRYSVGGKVLTIRTNINEFIIGNIGRVRIPVNNPNWRELIEQAVLKILSSNDCVWEKEEYSGKLYDPD